MGSRKMVAPIREALKRSSKKPVPKRPTTEARPTNEAMPAAAIRSVPVLERMGTKCTTSAIIVKVNKRLARNNRKNVVDLKADSVATPSSTLTGSVTCTACSFC